MEAFSTLLTEKFEAGAIGFHPLGRFPKVTHLAFADDVIIVFDGLAESLQTITSTLDNFKDMSGLRMNKDKTELFLAGLNPE